MLLLVIAAAARRADRAAAIRRSCRRAPAPVTAPRKSKVCQRSKMPSRSRIRAKQICITAKRVGRESPKRPSRDLEGSRNDRTRLPPQ